MSPTSPIFQDNLYANLADYTHYSVIRRSGDVVTFEPEKIAIAMAKAYLAVHGNKSEASSAIRETVKSLTETVIKGLLRSRPNGGTFHIEDIQDMVELSLMRAGHHEVARAYVLYREQQHQKRLQEQAKQAPVKAPELYVTDQGKRVVLDIKAIYQLIAEACKGLNDAVKPEPIVNEVLRNLYDGMPLTEVFKASILAARTKIEQDPDYSFVTARMLLHTIRQEVLGKPTSQDEMQQAYAGYFPQFIQKGIDADLLDARLAEFDLEKLGKALKHERDLQFDYLGLQTLYDRYFLHIQKQRIELPQVFFMRVAMGLALNEKERENRAIEFYEVLSSFDFMSSTPTLFNSGTPRSQLSSCYLTSIADDLNGIFEGIKENALLSKFAGGLGNDWSRVRALGSHIKGTNGESQGIVPFLKVVNDTAVAVNQGGKRKGAVCAYLESWHLDVEEFLELRKNTGDDRRRTHDMNTANWIPDLFMKRVMEDGGWTLLSPNDCPDLHDLYGDAFEKAYAHYEQKADRGEIKLFKRLRAVDLWRKMLSMLFETGHPWITFKDPCNIRSPQQHVGVVHSSNLCTEITLNTSDDEIAVCNLGSVNLARHIKQGSLNKEKLRQTVRTAMRMLDNVIDINFYPVEKAKTSNLRHRPVGLGIMGFQDALYQMRLPYASNAAIEFADESMEAVCYSAYEASSDLAAERGVYSSFKGSLWDQGIMPIDSIAMLAKQRGQYLDMNLNQKLDWEALRKKIMQQGMRNSNCIAIAPTATISNIIGVDQSIEPNFGNLSVKSNLSGEFTIVNQYLVNDLKALGLWDEVMMLDLKHFDGSLLPIERIPHELKALYATAFEVEPKWLIEAASRRQKWIDQAQSLNIYMAGASGRKLDDAYKLAWLKGLKTTYYLRSSSATYAEKSTIHTSNLNAVSTAVSEASVPATDVKFCSIDNPDCEACQ
ncbi:MAG: ribonucleoside-diphosphate reductase subunit alpha [Saezia sp.]